MTIHLLGDCDLSTISGGNVAGAIDNVVSKVPWVGSHWNGMSCGSRAMWVGTTAGSAAGGLTTALASPVAGSVVGPFAGTAAYSVYNESCLANQAAAKAPATPAAK